jgi:hypothetical protein
MPLHLIKLCVGIGDVDELKEWRAERRKREKRCLHHTRQWPKRAAEVLDGGSLFWVIRGQVQIRQRIIGFHHNLDEGGRAFCTIEMDHEIVPVRWRPWRPFQGWRYLEAKDAPPDDIYGVGADMPPQMVKELRELGLL